MKVDTSDLYRLIELDRPWSVQKTSWNNYVIWQERYTGEDGKSHSRPVYLHRWLMGISETETLVDHINFDTMDNRKSNLRIATRTENAQSRKGANKNSASGVRNVCKDGNRWLVQIQIDGKNERLGHFDDIEDAKRFAEEKRQELFGDFAGAKTK